jgi:hypothetical protein
MATILGVMKRDESIRATGAGRIGKTSDHSENERLVVIAACWRDSGDG